jgi:hypothetical protein
MWQLNKPNVTTKYTNKQLSYHYSTNERTEQIIIIINVICNAVGSVPNLK